MRNYWTILLLLIGCQACWGQVAIVSGGVLPEAPWPNMWFHDTVARVMMHYDDGQWTRMSDDERWSVSACNDLIVFHDKGKLATSSDDHILVSDSLGDIFMSNIREFFCGERLLACRLDEGWRFLDSEMAHPLDNINLAMPFQADCGELKPDTIGGEVCFCTARFVGRVLEQFYCKDMRNWGMMNGKGQWLIEPQFDAPFYFQDGFAEVVYYGQKRKINAQGEFVN